LNQLKVLTSIYGDHRYRERQKEKMEHYERQVAELSGRVEELMRDKVSLESRNSLLEKVVKLKDETRTDSANAAVRFT
jgi:exonuclease VII small subunit